MTLATIITISDFEALVEGAFYPETPTVSSSESALGQPLDRFASAAEMKAKAIACLDEGIYNYSFGLWYPSMKGQVSDRKVTLDPPREGHSFRYSLSGWGIIHLHLYVTPPRILQCRVLVNSQTRAESREKRYPEIGPASDWDWQAVETYAFRLSRRLASMGRTVPVAKRV